MIEHKESLMMTCIKIMRNEAKLPKGLIKQTFAAKNK